MGMGLRQLLSPMRGRESGGTQVNVLLQRRQKFLGPDGNRTSSFGVVVFGHLSSNSKSRRMGLSFGAAKAMSRQRKSPAWREFGSRQI